MDSADDLDPFCVPDSEYVAWAERQGEATLDATAADVLNEVIQGIADISDPSSPGAQGLAGRRRRQRRRK